jgi:hypothetical protein
MNGPVSRKNQQLEDAVLKKKPKTKYQRKWEGTFGKHTARCHPQSFIKQISKEGKPILLLVIIGTCGTFVSSDALCIAGSKQQVAHLLELTHNSFCLYPC